MFKESLEKIIRIALEEDAVFADVTSDLTITKNTEISFEIKPREEIVFCGREVIAEVFLQLKNSKKFKNSRLELKISAKNGDVIKAGKSIAHGHGDAKLIFAAERVILNLIQHLSGIATFTQKFVKKLNNKKIRILDTRKTLPGLRALEKQAVVAGGGKNHRYNLSEMILIKDNHIAAAGSVGDAILAAKKSAKKLKIEVECDTIKQVAKALKSRPDVIMLDNMKITDIKKSIALINNKCQIEISGGVNLNNIRKFSALKIDFISIGSLTHSARAVDVGLDSSNPNNA
ncbi:MAG: nicotinate-nucleotide diphosphorylase (carboxylating) [Alphaproteobacteria bacterium RIFCSPLOWO2_01_FULL_40_26]|nr:MAG: nicotinate-nucleotide diphosphorylase (carboxylating) [Alphaproteobacteria bacterium RIFCSPHIGHO2_02_FULL_40_34]OFW94935.1 MAG: nicotinate-nucleotide diphosphorylase (carboxylating) [Alphaproteobacteria bacterium RIFCSPLOWO2_01_FULL_40_26]OFX09919.1 MAG: nicotinate-nucleotide diphosphorylase (carboxylating) [Alphaproteobacteria bacterium RIFCSPLOWO2_02_FULL_40_19]OFX10761.1 MAG: nicotinate-nucleotide diphosphorylase (carboxylating) [Alphaproteobacteria bacterium RIFCSPLOWO2_12_FULL_40_11